MPVHLTRYDQRLLTGNRLLEEGYDRDAYGNRSPTYWGSPKSPIFSGGGVLVPARKRESVDQYRISCVEALNRIWVYKKMARALRNHVKTRRLNEPIQQG